MLGVDPARRLLFWLRVPFAADVVLVPLSIYWISADRPVGWWLLVFTTVKIAINVAGLWWAHRVVSSRSTDQ